MQRIALLLVAALCASSPAFAGAEKATSEAASATPAKSSKSKKRKKRVAAFRGHNAAKSSLRTEPLPKPSGDVWVRAELYEQLSRFYDRFEGKRIDLVSGFRFDERNSSRHYHASAMDIRIRGVSINEMYRFAESLDAGGMGIGLYPVSNFVHVDFRAPGEPSYRWTDTNGPGQGNDRPKKKKKPPHRTQPARKPTS